MKTVPWWTRHPNSSGTGTRSPRTFFTINIVTASSIVTRGPYLMTSCISDTITIPRVWESTLGGFGSWRLYILKRDDCIKSIFSFETSGNQLSLIIFIPSTFADAILEEKRCLRVVPFGEGRRAKVCGIYQKRACVQNLALFLVWLTDHMIQ